MVKQRNLAMLDRNLAKLYLVHPEWEPCNVIHDKNPMMLFLVIVPIAYLVIMLMIIFSLFMPCYLYLFLCWKPLGLTHSLWLARFVSPLFLPFPPPQRFTGWEHSLVRILPSSKAISWRLGLLLAMACFAALLGNDLWLWFYASLLLQDRFWCNGFNSILMKKALDLSRF